MGDESSPSQAEPLGAFTACFCTHCALLGEGLSENHKKFNREWKAPCPFSLSSSAPTSLPAADPWWGAAPLPAPPGNALLQSLCSREGHSSLLPPSLSLSGHTVTGRTFPTSHKDACALCPANTAQGPQAVATPSEGAAEPKSAGGLPVSPGDSSLLLEEQRANSLPPVCKAKKSYWCYSERREPNSAANKRGKEDQSWQFLLNSFEAVPLLSRGSSRLRSPRALSWLCWGTWPCSCQASLKQPGHLLGCRASPDVLVLMALKSFHSQQCMAQRAQSWESGNLHATATWVWVSVEESFMVENYGENGRCVGFRLGFFCLN